MSNDLDLWHEDAIVCPHCRYRHNDCLHEFFGDDWEDSADINCHDCGKEFHAERGVDVYYSTSKLERIKNHERD